MSYFKCLCPGCNAIADPELKTRLGVSVVSSYKLTVQVSALCPSYGATIGVGQAAIELDYPLVRPKAKQERG